MLGVILPKHMWVYCWRWHQVNWSTNLRCWDLADGNVVNRSEHCRAWHQPYIRDMVKHWMPYHAFNHYQTSITLGIHDSCRHLSDFDSQLTMGPKNPPSQLTMASWPRPRITFNRSRKRRRSKWLRRKMRRRLRRSSWAEESNGAEKSHFWSWVKPEQMHFWGWMDIHRYPFAS